MDNELEQQAIETFATVPEIYQQAFKEAGADFPDELVSAIKSDPNKAVELVTTNKDLKQAVIGIFQQNKEAIMQYMQKQTSMFKEGGKFDYLQKLQNGGLTRREALEAARKNKGYNKKQARLAYQNAKLGLKAQGYKGKEMREAARNIIAGQQAQRIELPEMSKIDTNIPISWSDQVTPIVVKTPSTADFVKIAPVAVNTTVTPRVKRVEIEPVYNIQPLMTEPPVKVVEEPTRTWLDSNVVSYPEINTIQGTSLPDTERAAHLAYLASLSNTASQNETAIPSAWEQAVAEYMKQNPGVSRRQAGRAINRRNRYAGISAAWNRVKYQKDGGKLAKENEVNKKYMKDSEKAGAKASKEMSDLKAKHKKDIAKLKKK